MIRHAWLLLLLGCAGSPAREEGPLDKLVGKTNAYTSFHLKAEITDGRQSVPVEMAFQAPDRALLRYGSVATTILAGGKAHSFLRGTTYSINYREAVEELKARYGGLAIGPAPEAVFTLGDGVRALLSVGRLGARLGWLDELRTYKAEPGNVYRHGQTEIVLREDGFIERTSIAGHGFVLKSVTINQPLPDGMFALPDAKGLQDASERMGPDLKRALEESYHRWVLETSTIDEVLERLIRIDLVRKYEPEKMAGILREAVRKSMAAFDTLHPAARPEVRRDKLQMERGKAHAQAEMMEEELHKEFEKQLDGYFRGMAVPPPQKEMLDVARRWQAALKRVVDEEIRKRFEAVIDEALPAQDKEKD